jgi:hypothetical protein
MFNKLVELLFNYNQGSKKHQSIKPDTAERRKLITDSLYMVTCKTVI